MSIRHLLLILSLGASLAGAINLSGTVGNEDTTSAPEITEIGTPFPECEPPEFYDPWLDRCRLPDTPDYIATETEYAVINTATPDPCIFFSIDWDNPPPTATLEALPTPHAGCAMPIP